MPRRHFAALKFVSSAPPLRALKPYSIPNLVAPCVPHNRATGFPRDLPRRLHAARYLRAEGTTTERITYMFSSSCGEVSECGDANPTLLGGLQSGQGPSPPFRHRDAAVTPFRRRTFKRVHLGTEHLGTLTFRHRTFRHTDIQAQDIQAQDF